LRLSVKAPDTNIPLPRVRIEPGGGAIEWLEIWHFRDLFLILAQRDLKLRYKQTALGIVWVILQPLVASLIFALIFGVLAKLPSDGTPYLLFVFVAMLPWNLFAGGVQRAGNSLISDARLITKVYFPRAIIPMASTAAVLIDFAVAGIVMLVLMIVFHAPFALSILSVPVLLLIALAVTIGMSLLFSALNVYYRDFAYALPFLLQVWMYASPVVYSSSLIPEQWRLLYGLNPLVGIIDGFRWALLGGPAPIASILEAAVGASVLLFIGASVFQRVERSFADVV
jgi:lipopolysaccharide transport system permease protein